MRGLDVAGLKDGLKTDGLKTDGLKTDGLVVMKDAQIRYEYYGPKVEATAPHCLWSVSKSISMALAGTAVLEGKLNLDEHLSTYYPESLRNAGDPNGALYRNIRIADLISMGSGFQWNEDYAGSIQISSVIEMLYLSGRRNMAEFVIRSPMRPEGPQGKWTYSTGDTTVLMGVLKKIYGSRYSSFPWRNLFNKIGMRGVRFEQDGSEVFLGGSYIHATPREMAKFGLLMMNDGVWNGTRVLPEGWVKLARTVSPAVLAPGTPTSEITQEGVYGSGFWLNQRVRGLPLPFPNSPEDLLLAAGHYGQWIMMIPSKGLIIARTGHDKEYWSKLDLFMSKAVACFSE